MSDLMCTYGQFSVLILPILDVFLPILDVLPSPSSILRFRFIHFVRSIFVNEGLLNLLVNFQYNFSVTLFLLPC